MRGSVKTPTAPSQRNARRHCLALVLTTATALFALAFAPSAQATPLHPFLATESLSGFNHACGVATDTEGDVYVSSAGESKIKIFNPAHTEIGSITNASEPCGLAVDTKGNLYVSEKALGKVVKYHPTAYPFSGAPSYEAPVTIDASGNAKGIAVDPTENRLYVAEGTRIASYNSAGVLGEDEQQQVRINTTTGGSFRLALPGEGTAARNEVQRVCLSGSVGATFTLSFESQTTAPLSYNFSENKPTAAEVQAALEALSTIGAGNVNVEGSAKRCYWVEFKGTLEKTNVPAISGSTENPAGNVSDEALSDRTAAIPYESSEAVVQTALEALTTIGGPNVAVEKKSNTEYLVTFTGALGSTDVPFLLSGDPSALTPSSATFPAEIQVGESIKGFNGRIGEGTLTEASGVGAYTYTNAWKERYLFAADPHGGAADRVYVFGGTNLRALALKSTIDGSETPAGSFTFSPGGAYLGVDQSNGHVLLYDAAHNVVDEFEASGQYFTQIVHAFTDAAPTALAVYPQWYETQRLEVKAEGGSFRLSFEGKSTGGEGTGDTSFASGTGNVVRATGGKGTWTSGSTTITITVEPTSASKFAVNQLITASGLQAGTTITACSTTCNEVGSTLTISKTTTEAKTGVALTAGNVTGASTSGGSGAFAVGQTLTGTGIAASTTILAVNGTTLTLSKVPSTAGSAIALTGTSKTVSNLSPSAGTTFLAGELISGTGIPAATTIAAVNEAEHTLTLSAAATAAGSGVPLSADLPYDAKAEKVQEALEPLSTIGKGNVSVSGLGGETRAPFIVRFIGALNDRNVPQMSCNGAALTGASHSCTPSTEREGSGPSRVYVTSGAAAGAQVLAFGPLAAPSRAPVSKLTFAFKKACGTVTDSYGDLYVAGETAIKVYDPEGGLLTTISDSAHPCGLAVDSEGNLYASEEGKVSLFAPSSYPPTSATTYGAPTIVGSYEGHRPIAVNPADDHLFVSLETKIEEYKSAKEGSALLHGELGKNLGTYGAGVDVCAKTGEIYAAGKEGAGAGKVWILNPAGTEVLARIDASGSLLGPFASPLISNIAVDQSNCHVLLSEIANRRVVEEYEASGAFVAQAEPTAGFPKLSFGQAADIAVDNGAHSPNRGNAYVAFFESLYGFGPLSYGEPPVAVTGPASAVGGGSATLGGTVDPRGFELTDCHFEYVSESAFKATGFSDLSSGGSQSCAPGLVEIGHGVGPVPVHAGLSVLDPEGRYRFRLLAENRFGKSSGDPGLFGPPILTTKPARPIRYTEATVNAAIDPSGLATTYRVRYGQSEAYGSTTPATQISATAGSTEVHIPLFGLAEGTEYHYCVAVENEAQTLPCADQTLVTQQRPEAQTCPNAQFRIGRSASLPDCRAYELVTPADTQGANLFAFGSASVFNNWRVTPSGPRAGESVAFDTSATLPGFEGSGHDEAYESVRGAAGWTTRLLSPPFAQGGQAPTDEGASPDHGYDFLWIGGGEGSLPGGHYLRTPDGISASPHCSSPEPGHFERLGCGSLGFDANASPRFLSLDAAHVIFTTGTCGGCTAVPLEDGAPPSGIDAIYDRTPGGPTHVVSLPPAGASAEVVHEFETKDAEYLGTSEDGSAVAFKVNETLYVRRNDAETLEVAEAPNTFAGLSANGGRIFYTTAVTGPGSLFACDLGAGSCAGPGAHVPTEIAPDSIFVNVSADGSHVYFTSTDALTGGEENDRSEVAVAPAKGTGVLAAGSKVLTGVSTSEGTFLTGMGISGSGIPGHTTITAVGAGTLTLSRAAEASGSQALSASSPNFYLWDGASTRFIAVLDPQDLLRFGSAAVSTNLAGWVRGVNPPTSNQDGIATDASRSTPDGRFLVFQSHAQLTSYDNTEATAAACGDPEEEAGDRCGEVYRYDSADGSLTCVSCDPSGAPPSAEAELWNKALSTADSQTLDPNVTDNGQAVFFETHAALLPEDANSVNDVYEWKADGTEGPGGDICKRPGGCLALISSGKGESPSFLYGMTPDGHDVFIWTLERLLPSDLIGSVSFYDARVGGGFPEAEAQELCEGDACQGQGPPPPGLPGAGSEGFQGPGNEPPPKAGRCAKGKHRVKGRCVSKHRKRKSHHKRRHRRANRNRRASR